MDQLVSIITPTYNRAYIIQKAIKSVLEQTYSNWELLVIDDGSNDDTNNVVSSFHEPKIKYFPQLNKGVSAARNLGLEKAQGQWITYLDSDNILYPQHLEKMLQAITADNAYIFSFPRGHRYQELWLEGKMVERIEDLVEFKEHFTAQDIVHRKLHTDTNGLFHSRKVIDDGIRFDEKLTKMEDWDLLLTLCERYPNGFLYVNEILYEYYQKFGGDGLVSNSGYQEWADIFEYIFQKHKNDQLMKGQGWYPHRVEKWQSLADQFQKGNIPSYHLYYFKKYWPEKYKD